VDKALVNGYGKECVVVINSAEIKQDEQCTAIT
jgi:hypothetical protein